MSEKREKFLIEIHRLAGKCGHCRKVNCPDKRKWSELPTMISTAHIIAALDVMDSEAVTA